MGKHLVQAQPLVHTFQCQTGKYDNNNNNNHCCHLSYSEQASTMLETISDTMPVKSRGMYIACKKVTCCIDDMFNGKDQFLVLVIAYYYAKQKHLGCKKGKANQKQQLSDYGYIYSCN